MALCAGGKIPGEGTADAQIQLLTGIHGQRLVAVGLSEAVHGVPDVGVRDGAELGSVNSSLPVARLVHHRLDGIQYL